MRSVTAILRDIETVKRSTFVDDKTKEKILAQYQAELQSVANALPDAPPPTPPKTNK